MFKNNILLVICLIFITIGAVVAANAPLSSDRQTLVTPDGKIDWSRYYNSDEIYKIMKELEARYPKLAKVYVIGKSYLGKDLHLMEITNRDIKPAMEKPAIYIDGNMHTGEQTGAILALYMIHHLLTNYGKDEQVTHLVDNRTFYLRPKYGVDAQDWWLVNPGDTDYGGSVHPRDNDLDGEADEDPTEDLNGDGQVTTMRIKDANGEWKVSEKDPRALVRRQEHELTGTFYRVLSEGIDNDGDGKFNEDGLGGINLGSNFHWGNQNREQVHRSPYAMSEPETQATIKFWMSHPNIYMMIDLHTSGYLKAVLYYAGGKDMAPSDLALYKYFGAAYAQFTHRAEILSMMGEFPTDIKKLGMGDPEPYVHWYMGIFGWCEELWGSDYSNPFVRKYDGDGDKEISPEEFLSFLDKEVDGRWFVPWKPFNHPQLGLVEIGGLVRKFSTQNPPPRLLEKELELKLPWYLYLAEVAPQVKIKETKATPIVGNAVSLKVIVENQGFLPTNITQQAIKIAVAKPVIAKIELKNAVIIEGKEKMRLGNIPGNQYRYQMRSFPDNERSVCWILKKTGKNAEATITVISEKGGTDSIKVKL
jgi:hypothetical protein